MADIKIECAYDDLIPTSKVLPNPRNPNHHPRAQIEALAKIIKAQGWRVPITISNRSGFIVRGHGRLDAAKLLGIEQCPVDFQDYESDAQEWADIIADNKISELAEMQEDILAALMVDISDSSFDISVLDGLGINENFLCLPGNDTEKLRQAEKKIEPYKKLHILISVDVSSADILADTITKMKKLKGVEVEQSAN